MFLKKIPYLFAIFCFPFILQAEFPKPANDFILISLPKSGSHLMCKLLKQLSSNNQISVFELPEFASSRIYFPPHKELVLDECLYKLSSPKQSYYTHFNLSRFFKLFTYCHPDYAKLVLVRDLRDICVSTTYYIDSMLEANLGKGKTFDEKLLFIIEGKGFLENFVFNVEKQAQTALAWMEDPAVATFRFEDLCGPNGGGSQSLQDEQILRVAKLINVSLTPEELRQVADCLWGGTATFREGHKGSWKEHFKPQHIEAFKKKLGTYLVKLGYEKDNNW